MKPEELLHPELNARTVVWFVKRPRLYPELWRMAKSAALGREPQPDTHCEAERWCLARAISTAEAVQRVTGWGIPGAVHAKYAHVFAEAKSIAEACPVGMGGASDIDLLYWLVEYTQATRVLETGVAYGWSSLALLLSLSRRNGLLVSIDRPYLNRNNDAHVGCVIPAALRAHWRLLRSADREGIPKAVRALGTIDVCHYDSDKSYGGKRWAFPRLWRALKPGGILIADDAGDDVAFRDFCEETRTEPIIVRTALDYCVEIGIQATSVRPVSKGETKFVGVLVK